jgi:phospholipid/cholesterol/gamma-HCH transport system permease protein
MDQHPRTDQPDQSEAAVKVEPRDGGVTLRFSGGLDAQGAGDIWNTVTDAAQKGGKNLVLDVSAVTACDTSGAALLLAAEHAGGGEARLEGASPKLQAILARVRDLPPPSPPKPEPVPTWREVIVGGLGMCGEGFAFLGEAAVALVRLPARRRLFRMSDLLRTADQAGVSAIPLALLLGTLIGLILAFQSLVPMRRFGADIYVANLVAISLIRELGPLLAAVILAGRTGSAFAAEIGTMKVNQEIDALTTMSIDPMTMLVLPRLVAAMIVMPALTIVLELAGLLGMTVVMVGAGYPLEAIGNQVSTWVKASDFYGGMFKALVFGAAVAAIGCRAGLSTGVGPRAVGLSATAAVVGGIVITVVLDGIFAVLFYRLGI